MSKRKADCTPAEWARRLAKEREYRAKPAAKRKQREGSRRYYERETEKMKANARRHGALPSSIARKRDRARLKNTGVDPALFEALWLVQGGKCAVCSVGLAPGTKTHADHCHDTGEARGLLCARCNFVEGAIKRSGLTPQGFAERLTQYLEEPPARLAKIL